MNRKSVVYIISIIFAVFINLTQAEDDQQKLIHAAKNKVLPALVHIEPIKEIFSSGKRMKVQVTGSGIIFSPEGYVLTNNHVAEKARQVKCTLGNRDEVRAEVVGLDEFTDLAVLKLDLSKEDYKTVPFANFGDSDSLEVGDLVMALGSPLGLSRSLSFGVISSIDRYFEDRGQMVSPFNLWIQTDAAINPGNSGGPLVNLQGEVIGINARAIFFGENLGFAIPINTAKLVIERILKYGHVERSWIGIDWQETKEFRLYRNAPDMSGVLVASVDKNSPAAQAGIEAGDLVYAINEKSVDAIYQEELPRLRKLVAEIPVGDKMKIAYWRHNKKMDAVLTTEQRGKFEGNEVECDEWGISVKEITPPVVENLNLKDSKGVLISGVRNGSISEEAEISRGHILRFIDNIEITDLDQFKKVYENLKLLPEKGRMLRLVSRNTTFFALLKEK